MRIPSSSSERLHGRVSPVPADRPGSRHLPLLLPAGALLAIGVLLPIPEAPAWASTSWTIILLVGVAGWSGGMWSGLLAGPVGHQTSLRAKEALREMRTTEREMRRSRHKPLVPLPDRDALLKRVERAIRRTEYQADYVYAVLVIDPLGETASDEWIAAASGRLQGSIRPEDMLARSRGGGFAIFLHQLHNAADAARVAERVIRALERPVSVAGERVCGRAQAGVAVSTSGYTAANDVLRDAGIAVSLAQPGVDAGFRFFDTAMHECAVHRLRLEAELRLALEGDQFRLFFQPIVAVATGRITGFEALIRWQHPQRGLLSPGEFISLAEEIGLIVPIGRWVLREACRQMQRWCADFPNEDALAISVNISGRQFVQSDLANDIREILAETSLDPARLKLEITESVIVENSERATAMFVELKGLGMHLQMDDFGTGYSSLSYLQQFPIDALKIDGSFVDRIECATSAGIVDTIVSLGRNLCMEVVAERVETEAQLQYLRSIGCEYAQGYLFSRPLDAVGAAALLRGSPRW